MNIQQAKEEIRNTLRAYLQKDPDGGYCYPAIRQRPLLLMGPPGVGKTAIVRQAAREMGLPLVAYTMTHHTRQSAVGLPLIQQRDYCGKAFSITEYTMSEIIGSVYRAMEETGKQEGILFLDEINCVSETLAPTMLQFLQNKTFGNHALPEGWAIIGAGNPPEYNKSVRAFDVVTLDRVRSLWVEADVQAFLDYGSGAGVHGAVLSYLRLKPERFYHVRRKENSVEYVTARGWEDLSRLLQSYGTLEIPVTESVVREFLCQEDTSRDFYTYYCLYAKYGRDYAIREILNGQIGEEAYTDRLKLARGGDFTERFLVTNLVLEQLCRYGRAYQAQDGLTVGLHEAVKSVLRQNITLEDYLEARRKALETKVRFQLLSGRALGEEKRVLNRLDAWNLSARENRCYDREKQEAFLRERFQQELKLRQQRIEETKSALSAAIAFLLECFGDGQELTLLLTGISASGELMDYIGRHGCPAYTRLGERLLCQKEEARLREECLAAVSAAEERKNG